VIVLATGSTVTTSESPEGASAGNERVALTPPQVP